MKIKLLNLGLLVTSLFGYLEWGGGNTSLLYKTELEILSKIFTDPASVMHPLIILPLIGQIALLITLFQKTASWRLTLVGIGTIGILIALMFFIGLISLNWKILASTLPFLALAIIAIRMRIRRKG